MSSLDGAPACATLGDFITGVVLKELWAVQLSRHSTQEGCKEVPPFEASAAAALITRLAPALVAGVVEAACEQLPQLSDLAPSSLVPDLDNFPAEEEVDGLAVLQRRQLFAGLEAALAMFGDPDIAREAGLEPPLLPRPSLACIAAQIIAALEHCLLQRQPAVGRDLDLAGWQRFCCDESEQVPPGSRAEMLLELERRRCAMLNLEKALEVQVGRTEVQELKRKEAVSRLYKANTALENSVRQHAEQQRSAEQRLADLQLRLRHEQWAFEERGKRIEQLEEQFARLGTLQEDVLLREREYGKRVLQVGLQEFQSVCREKARSEPQLADEAQRTLTELRSALDAHFEERQNSFEASVRKTLAEERLRRSELPELLPPRRSIAAQTEPPAPPEEVPKPTPRLSTANMVLFRGSCGQVLVQSRSGLRSLTPVLGNARTPRRPDTPQNRRVRYTTGY